MLKKPEKLTIKFEYDHEGSGGSSTSKPLNSEEAVGYIDFLGNRYDELIIQGISPGENTLYLTTPKSKEREHIDNKLYGINKLIKDYINKNALASGTEVIAVFAEGKLKGLFSDKKLGRLKATILERTGHRSKDIRTEIFKLDRGI